MLGSNLIYSSVPRYIDRVIDHQNGMRVMDKNLVHSKLQQDNTDGGSCVDIYAWMDGSYGPTGKCGLHCYLTPSGSTHQKSGRRSPRCWFLRLFLGLLSSFASPFHCTISGAYYTYKRVPTTYKDAYFAFHTRTNTYTCCR